MVKNIASTSKVPTLVKKIIEEFKKMLDDATSSAKNMVDNKDKLKTNSEKCVSDKKFSSPYECFTHIYGNKK